MINVVKELSVISYEANAKYKKFFSLFNSELNKLLDLLGAEEVVIEIDDTIAKGSFVVPSEGVYYFHYGMTGVFDGYSICLWKEVYSRCYLPLDDHENMAYEFRKRLTDIQQAG